MVRHRNHRLPFAGSAGSCSRFSRRRHDEKIEAYPLSHGKGTENDRMMERQLAKTTKRGTDQFDPHRFRQNSHLSDLRHAVRLEHVLDLPLDVAEADDLRRGGGRFPSGADDADAAAPRARVARRRRRDHISFAFNRERVNEREVILGFLSSSRSLSLSSSLSPPLTLSKEQKKKNANSIISLRLNATLPDCIPLFLSHHGAGDPLKTPSAEQTDRQTDRFFYPFLLLFSLSAFGRSTCLRSLSAFLRLLMNGWRGLTTSAWKSYELALRRRPLATQVVTSTALW